LSFRSVYCGFFCRRSKVCHLFFHSTDLLFTCTAHSI